jgi:hypothetical protein
MNNDENSLEKEFQRYADLISKQAKEKMDNPLQAFTAGKNAIDAIRLLNDYAQDIKDISKRGEFMRIIGELSIELGETKMRLGGAIEEIEGLKKEIEKLKDPTLRLMFDAKLGLYFENDGSTDRSSPFCNGCYDKDKKTIRLSRMPVMMETLGKYKCPVCNAIYP